MGDDYYARLKVHEGEHWSVFVHESQYYLGRTYIASNSDIDKGILELSLGEATEFFSTASMLTSSVEALFQPDRMNYAYFGNEWNHLHIHFIPRYQSSREFDGIVFEDHRWGRNYAPYDKDFKVPESTLLKLRDMIADKLK